MQTPQYFRSDRGRTGWSGPPGPMQEVFYRSIQTARDRLGASICVGSCAVYRRAALEPQGGTTLIDYAEDVHTGLDVRRLAGSWVRAGGAVRPGCARTSLTRSSASSTAGAPGRRARS